MHAVRSRIRRERLWSRCQCPRSSTSTLTERSRETSSRQSRTWTCEFHSTYSGWRGCKATMVSLYGGGAACLLSRQQSQQGWNEGVEKPSGESTRLSSQWMWPCCGDKRLYSSTFLNCAKNNTHKKNIVKKLVWQLLFLYIYTFFLLRHTD